MAKERREMALRLGMHGSMKPEKFPELDAKLRQGSSDQKKPRA